MKLYQIMHFLAMTAGVCRGRENVGDQVPGATFSSLERSAFFDGNSDCRKKIAFLCLVTSDDVPQPLFDCGASSHFPNDVCLFVLLFFIFFKKSTLNVLKQRQSTIKQKYYFLMLNGCRTTKIIPTLTINESCHYLLRNESNFLHQSEYKNSDPDTTSKGTTLKS